MCDGAVGIPTAWIVVWADVAIFSDDGGHVAGVGGNDIPFGISDIQADFWWQADLVAGKEKWVGVGLEVGTTVTVDDAGGACGEVEVVKQRVGEPAGFVGDDAP